MEERYFVTDILHFISLSFPNDPGIHVTLDIVPLSEPSGA